MDGSLPQLALIGALVFLNAAFAGSEMALISLREGQLQRLEQRSENGRVLARLARDPNRFLATIQIGITLAGFLASAVAAVALAEPLVEPLAFLGSGAEPVAIVVVTLALTFVTLVLGELAPKRVAMQRAERWGLLVARPVAGLALLARPVIWVLGASTNLAVRLMGGDPARHREDVTEGELRDLVASQTSFTPAQRTIISGAFEIGDRTLREVLVPRLDVVAIRAHRSIEDGLAELVASCHSRAPVVGAEVDDVVGVVHWRDLMTGGGTVGDRARPVVVLPESVGVIEGLRRLQAERQPLAVVSNEYGGMEGIVTIEDLVEELVGEIYDETDRDVLGVVREEEGALVMPGTFPIHDLCDLDVHLPEGDYVTVAGLVLDRLGRIPSDPGERVEVDGWLVEVLEVKGRAVTLVRLRPTATRRGVDRRARSEAS